MDILRDDLQMFARRNGLTLGEDPFHASTGYEFRKGSGSGSIRVGFLCSPETATFYRRRVEGRETVEYSEIRTVALEKLTCALVEEVVLNKMTNEL